jgi:hypothetical protein
MARRTIDPTQRAKAVQGQFEASLRTRGGVGAEHNPSKV